MQWKKEEEWKPFRNALDKKDRKEFDEMWELPKFYIPACSNSVQHVRLHPILMAILLYHYKQLTACISEVERLEAKVNSRKKKEWLTLNKEEEKQQDKEELLTITTTLDSYFVSNNNKIAES